MKQEYNPSPGRNSKYGSVVHAVLFVHRHLAAYRITNNLYHVQATGLLFQLTAGMLFTQLNPLSLL